MELKMENICKNESSENLTNNPNESFESNKWNITIEDLSMKDLNSIEKEDIVFFRSSCSCSCTC